MSDAATTIDYFLANLPAFKDVPKADRFRIAQASREQAFPKGTTIFREGAKAEAVWVVTVATVAPGRWIPDN